MWRKVHGSCFRLLKPLNAVWILVAAASTSGSVRSMSGIRKNLRITLERKEKQEDQNGIPMCACSHNMAPIRVDPTSPLTIIFHDFPWSKMGQRKVTWVKRDKKTTKCLLLIVSHKIRFLCLAYWEDPRTRKMHVQPELIPITGLESELDRDGVSSY